MPHPIPKGRGDDARLYLEERGLVSRPGFIRASDYELYAADPFLYYLRVRLGLTHRWKQSEALSHGSWYHRALEFPGTTDLSGPYGEAVNTRLSELASAADEMALSAPAVERLLNDERRRALEALIWAQALRTVKLPNGKTVAEMTSDLESLGREIFVRLPSEVDNTMDVVCQFDEVLVDRRAGHFFVLDDKTTSLPVSQRMFACPIEFQTRLYAATARRWAHTQSKLLGLSFGGVIHRVLRKPTIRFGANDRAFNITTRELKSGPRKGQTVVEKEYFGDPDPTMYLERVRNWYAADGDFIDKKVDWELDPPVNISTTRLDTGATLSDDEFTTQFMTIAHAATRTANPGSFTRSAKNLLAPGPLSVYAPFYVQPVHRWPEIVKNEGFIQQWRDVPDPTPLEGE